MRNPLNLPAGSVRAILAILVVCAACVPVARGQKLEAENAAVVAIVLHSYFSARKTEAQVKEPTDAQ